jgi:hypothetical protein
MQVKRIFILFAIIAPFLNSCFEKDHSVPPYPGVVTTIYDNIENYQSYFDFKSGKVIKTNPVDAWQLGFECGAKGWHILVNSGAQWLIYNTGQTSLDNVTTPPLNANWRYDIQSDYPDSTAVGNWVVFEGTTAHYTKNVYKLGQYAGSGYANLKQLVFLAVTDTSFQFYYKELNSGNSDTVTISKLDSVNFVYYSFAEKTQLNLEPDKSRYDIVFGPYYDLATEFGVTIPYLVRGVLLNVSQTKAAIDSSEMYSQINSGSLGNINLLHQRDIIGYRWKEVNVNVSSGTGAYTIKSNYSYIIQTVGGNSLKMHFLGYTLDGNNGYPQFEYQSLK